MIGPKIKTLIVEDDSDHLHHLEKLINTHYPYLHLINPCSSGSEALQAIRQQNPDLIFLDIDLTDMNAFELLDNFHEHEFQIIFTTAYNEYAVKAFRAHAIDYLLKPILEKELSEALQKVQYQRKGIDEFKKFILEPFHKQNKFLKVNEKNKTTFLPKDQIIYLQAGRSYTEIHYYENGEKKKLLASNNLSVFESQLIDFDFVRIHQSYLVNRSQIYEFLKKDKKVKLFAGEILPVSRSKTDLIN